MNRQNQRRNNPKKMEQVVCAAPQAHPVSHHGEGPQVNSDSECPRRPWKDEKKAMGYTIHNLKYKLERLEGLMELRETAFKAEYKKKYEIIASHEATISSLKSELQFRVAQVENLQHRSHQEKEDMAARLEAEKQKLSEQNNQMFQLDLDKQKGILLQIDLQMKQLVELEQELHEKDDLILHLREEKMGLSSKLTEVTDQLRNKKAEFLQSDQAWQTKYEALQEKFSKLEVKEQSWKTSVEQVEEQKKELEELSIKLKESEKETTECLLQNNNWQAKYDALEEKFRQQLEKEHSREEKITQLEETTEELEENEQILEVTPSQVDVEKTEPEDICFTMEEETEVKKESTTDKKKRKKAMKVKQKQETDDLKRKHQEEQKNLKCKQKLEKLQEKEMNKKEAQVKAELQKREKEEKRESKRKEKERKTGDGGEKCDSEAKVERSAGCSIECQQ